MNESLVYFVFGIHRDLAEIGRADTRQILAVYARNFVHKCTHTLQRRFHTKCTIRNVSIVVVTVIGGSYHPSRCATILTDSMDIFESHTLFP